MTHYLGAGEYELDFQVLRTEADSPEQALDRFLEPKQGYGRDDGTAYVVAEEAVQAFSINDSTVRHRRAIAVADRFKEDQE